MRRSLERIGIRLKDRGTDLSRFREKRKKGTLQMSSSGWLADYPDPENFLFLFYGPNGKVDFGGPNAFNYANSAFDKLFESMESMANTPARQEIINKMFNMLQHNAPAVWMFNPKTFILVHDWYRNVKPHNMSYNTMKYRRIDVAQRLGPVKAWNKPIVWPVILFCVLMGLLFVPTTIAAYRRERGL